MADNTRTIEIVVETQDAVKNIDDLNKSLDKNEKQTEDTKEETQKYEKQLADTGKVTGAFTTQLDKMTGGMFSTVKGILSSVKALKSLRVALIATGLGAILVVVGSLAAAFTKLQGPMNFINDILAGMNSAFNEVVKRIGIFGEAIGFLLDGEFTKAWETAGKAVEGIGGALVDAYNAGTDIEEQTRRINILEAQRLLQVAELERKIEQLKLTAEDQSKTQEVRLKASNEAYALQEKRVGLLVDLERQRIAVAEAAFEQSTKTDQDQIDLLNLRREGAERIVTLEGQLVELNNSRQALIKETNTKLKEQLDLLTQIEEAANKLDDSYADMENSFKKSADASSEFTDALEKRNEELNNQRDQEVAANDAAAEAASEATETQGKLNTALGVTAQAGKTVLDIFQGKVEGKDIFKTVLSTLGSILGIVTGVNVSGITGLIGGLFADGGLLKGPSHKEGGIWVNAEGGEGIINKRSMAIPWVKDLASELNQIGGGVKFADGGIVASQTAQEAQLAQISSSLSEQRIVLPIEDLRTVNTRVTTIEDRATL